LTLSQERDGADPAGAPLPTENSSERSIALTKVSPLQLQFPFIRKQDRPTNKDPSAIDH
jgi:hypothetical protein